MPSYDGHYKWEDSAGLEHHCGTCSIPLHNPRALQTCFGVHVEPCYRFHQQLHFVQKSHECFGCKTADEVHFKRHGVIARLVKAIKNYDKENAVAQPKFGGRKTSTPQSEAEGSVIEGSFVESSAMSVVSNDYDFSSKQETLTKKQKKALRKTEKVAKKVREDLDSVTKEEVDHVSEAIHLKAHGGKSASCADSKEEDKDLPYGEGICPQLVAENLFFTAHQRRKYYGKFGHRPAPGLGVEETPAKPTSTQIPTPAKTPRHKFGTSSRQASGGTPNSPEDPLTLIDPKIFERLGVPASLGSDNSKKRRDLIKKLASLIQEDVEIDQKELDDSRMRQAGFWRFVSADTLNNLVELHKGFVWATGELKNKEKYGESLKVTKQTQTLEEEHAEMVNVDGVVKQVSDELEAEGLVPSDSMRTLGDVNGDKSHIVSKENIRQPMEEEKRHKRLSSQEGFTIPKSKTNARSKAQPKFSGPMTPVSTPRAKSVLRIVGTNGKDTKPFTPVPLRRKACPVPKPRPRGGTASGFYGSLKDTEA